MRKINFFILTALVVVTFGCNDKRSSTIHNGTEARSAQQKTSVKTIDDSPAFTLPDWQSFDFERKPVSISSSFGDNKLTIIDFWASWCTPCLREIPQLVNIYSQYQDKGLGIVGISLDSNEDDWKDAISRNHMAWTHYSELKGWKDQGVQMLGIDGIPFTIIVDSKGRVLASGLRGNALADFVAKHLE